MVAAEAEVVLASTAVMKATESEIAQMPATMMVTRATRVVTVAVSVPQRLATSATKRATLRENAPIGQRASKNPASVEEAAEAEEAAVVATAHQKPASPAVTRRTSPEIVPTKLTRTKEPVAVDSVEALVVAVVVVAEEEAAEAELASSVKRKVISPETVPRRSEPNKLWYKTKPARTHLN